MCTYVCCESAVSVYRGKRHAWTLIWGRKPVAAFATVHGLWNTAGSREPKLTMPSLCTADVVVV